MPRYIKNITSDIEYGANILESYKNVLDSMVGFLSASKTLLHRSLESGRIPPELDYDAQCAPYVPLQHHSHIECAKNHIVGNQCDYSIGSTAVRYNEVQFEYISNGQSPNFEANNRTRFSTRKISPDESIFSSEIWCGAEDKNKSADSSDTIVQGRERGGAEFGEVEGRLNSKSPRRKQGIPCGMVNRNGNNRASSSGAGSSSPSPQPLCACDKATPPAERRPCQCGPSQQQKSITPIRGATPPPLIGRSCRRSPGAQSMSTTQSSADDSFRVSSIEAQHVVQVHHAYDSDVGGRLDESLSRSRAVELPRSLSPARQDNLNQSRLNNIELQESLSPVRQDNLNQSRSNNVSADEEIENFGWDDMGNFLKKQEEKGAAKKPNESTSSSIQDKMEWVIMDWLELVHLVFEEERETKAMEQRQQDERRRAHLQAIRDKVRNVDQDIQELNRSIMEPVRQSTPNQTFEFDDVIAESTFPRYMTPRKFYEPGDEIVSPIPLHREYTDTQGVLFVKLKKLHGMVDELILDYSSFGDPSLGCDLTGTCPEVITFTSSEDSGRTDENNPTE